MPAAAPAPDILKYTNNSFNAFKIRKAVVFEDGLYSLQRLKRFKLYSFRRA